ERGAILDRLAGVEEFGLAVNVATGRFRGALQADERGVADCLEDGHVRGHWISLLLGPGCKTVLLRGQASSGKERRFRILLRRGNFCLPDRERLPVRLSTDGR